jgi:hypothetical protein
MIHLSGAFDYQPLGTVAGQRGLPETQPAAIYVGMMLLDDNGIPVFGADGPGPGDVRAWVTLSRPQAVGDLAVSPLSLDLSLDFYFAGYAGFTARIDVAGLGLSPDWIPLALIIVVGEPGTPVGVLTAAPYPIPNTGIAPPLPPVFEP